MPLIIRQENILDLDVDVIVNAANTDLEMGGGVCGSIFRGAGVGAMTEACRPLAPIQTGDAVMTPGFALKANAVIHTAGPRYIDGRHGERSLLEACYRNSIRLADDHGFESIAFPLISSGIYGYPKKEAFDVARQAILDALETIDMTVILTLLGSLEGLVDDALLREVSVYLNAHVASKKAPRDEYANRADVDAMRMRRSNMAVASDAVDYEAAHSAAVLPQRPTDMTFSEKVLDWIDRKGMDDVEVYKRANIDRKLFSKIRSNKDYQPARNTVISLALALELSLNETDDLLKSAGYALSDSKYADVVIAYCIMQGIHDPMQINLMLLRLELPTLT